MKSEPKNLTEALNALENLTGSMSEELRAKLQRELRELEQKIEKLKPQLTVLADTVQDEAKRVKEKVEVRIKESPWTTFGIMGLIFLVIGYLLGGRGSRRSD